MMTEQNLLTGAREIASYVYGTPEKEEKVQDLWRRVRYPYRFPMFKLGGTLVARRSSIDAWMEEQERSASGVNDNHPPGEQSA